MPPITKNLFIPNLQLRLRASVKGYLIHPLIYTALRAENHEISTTPRRFPKGPALL